MVPASEVVTDVMSTIAPSRSEFIPSDYLRVLHQTKHWYLWRLVVFAGLYAIAAFGIYGLTNMPSPSPGLILSVGREGLCLILYLLAAASLHGISLFVHEGVHGVLCQNRQANRWLSMLCALPVLQNFAAYRVLHLQHHAHLGQLGDPDHYRNYTAWSWLEFLMYWGRLLIGYPAYIVMIPILGWRQGDRHDRLWIGLEIALLISMLISAALTILTIPNIGSVLMHIWLVPMLIINTIVNIRGMSQHTLLEHEQDVILGTRTLLCNPLTRFFMCNENYHLEHHLYPGVPWYHLPKLHAALADKLRDRGAVYLPSYLAFVREFAIASFTKMSMGSVTVR